METEIIGNGGVEWTDAPRDLTEDETAQVEALSRLDGIKLHRLLTRSTLPAAIQAVDRIRSAGHDTESAMKP